MLGVSLLPCLAGVIESITPTFGTTFTNIEIKGTNFLTDTSCLEITAGEYPCLIDGDVREEDGYQIVTCTVETMPDTLPPMQIGQHYAIRLRQGSYGYSLITSEQNTQRHYYLKPSITAVSPRVGSVGGGVYVTINGEGFITDLTTVSIDGTVCLVQDVSYTEVVCISQTRVGASNGLVEVWSFN